MGAKGRGKQKADLRYKKQHGENSICTHFIIREQKLSNKGGWMHQRFGGGCGLEEFEYKPYKPAHRSVMIKLLL